MTGVLAQMSVLILSGVVLRRLRPFGIDPERLRRTITGLVFNALLPALVLSALWGGGAHPQGWKISLFGVAIVLFGLAATLCLDRALHLDRRQLGAAMLGIAFSNVTFLGLPVLERLFGPELARPIVIQIDLFSTAPLVFTLGVYIASRYGGAPANLSAALRALIVNPPLWAAFAALLLGGHGIPRPAVLETPLETAASSVAPLMLLALGLGLRWNAWRKENTRLVALASGLKLIALPLFGLSLTHGLEISGDTRAALVLEAGMPSMLLGIVYCDRYRLDTGLYAMLATTTTVLALASLPAWHLVLGTIAGEPT
ncbi:MULTISPECIES: AEC family transporter [Methylococcus]|uniref:AEC family transporter n=1 Tax=Methylococcus capsulatus TaxID=414 RepID=A0ABZ2F1F7_METCP|nr:MULTISPECIES: AEC family transporter [Methylococcus]MDF9392843.1 AEC family transporter [Methylococcus capsulatus]